LKSGTVEMISADDGVTPLLSLTEGTVFGDISFYVPLMKRNLSVRCVTYCEIYVLSRSDILKAIQNYPVDRRNIIQSAKERMKHARTLYSCKLNVRGLDRTEDEGIAWLKRRWWEISDTVSKWKKKSGDNQIKCELPPEEAVYHCAKYIGQLVLCGDGHLQKKSLFANVKFPWILRAESTFVRVWHYIVLVTVFGVLVTYPVNITLVVVPSWFKFFQYWVDFVYAADLGVSLVTSTKKENVPEEFTSVLFARCKRPTFFFDILATIWLELLATLSGLSDYYNISQSNRLIKIYILFNINYIKGWNIQRDPIYKIIYDIVLITFCYFYISAYAIYILSMFIPKITEPYFFGRSYLRFNITDEKFHERLLNENGFLVLPIAYTFEKLFFESLPEHLIDIYLAIVISFIEFFIYMSTKCKLISYLYLRGRDEARFLTFVSNLKTYYVYHKIHCDLLRRLDTFLTCQWKYFRGIDIMQPNTLKEEPFDILWKIHGEVAERIIGESMAFVGADPALVRELAYATKFLIMPKDSTLFVFGVQCRNVTWIVQVEYYINLMWYLK
jgi:hypothetical protein